MALVTVKEPNPPRFERDEIAGSDGTPHFYEEYTWEGKIYGGTTTSTVAERRDAKIRFVKQGRLVTAYFEKWLNVEEDGVHGVLPRYMSGIWTNEWMYTVIPRLPTDTVTKIPRRFLPSVTSASQWAGDDMTTFSTDYGKGWKNIIVGDTKQVPGPMFDIVTDGAIEFNTTNLRGGDGVPDVDSYGLFVIHRQYTDSLITDKYFTGNFSGVLNSSFCTYVTDSAYNDIPEGWYSQQVENEPTPQFLPPIIPPTVP